MKNAKNKNKIVNKILNKLKYFMNKDFVLNIIDTIINKDNAICSDSFIEKLHIHILLTDTVNENDKKTIELFIKYNIILYFILFIF